MSALDPFEQRFRDKLLKSWRGPKPPKREPQAPRLLGEITEGIRKQDASGRGRTRLSIREQFEALRGSDLGAAMIGDLTGDAVEVAGDRDIFGAGALSLASRQLRLRAGHHASVQAVAISERNDALLEQQAAELEERASAAEAERMGAAVEALMEQYPDMSHETAMLMVVGIGDEDEGPVAA